MQYRALNGSSGISVTNGKSDRTVCAVPIARAGTAYANDGGTKIVTPHDDCVLIMPTRHPKRGETAVRLGRYIE